MYLFTVIIFIAELIIAVSVICAIQKLDKRVCMLDSQVTEFRPEIEKSLKTIRTGVVAFEAKVKGICEFIRLQQERYIIKIVQNILTFILIFMLRKKRKKYLSAIELAISLSKLL